MRYCRPLLIATAALWLSGCGTYDTRFAYRPSPATTALIENRAEQHRSGRVLATIVGVRRDDPSIAHPNTVEVRVRIENGTDQTVTVDPADLELLSADLRSFAVPTTEPDATITLEPGGRSTITAYFPLPDDGDPGPLNMDGLNLTWMVQVDGQNVQGSATFDRRRYRYYHRHYYYRYPHYHRSRYHYGLGLWDCY